MKKLLVLFAIAWAATTSTASAQEPISAQDKCSNIAKEYFISLGHKNVTSSSTFGISPIEKTSDLGSCDWSYSVHYNKKRKICFIQTSAICINQIYQTNIQDLVDVINNNKIAYYFCNYKYGKGAIEQRSSFIGDKNYDIVNGHEFNYKTKKWDVVSDDYLSSLKDPFSDPFYKKFNIWVEKHIEE